MDKKLVKKNARNCKMMLLDQPQSQKTENAAIKQKVTKRAKSIKTKAERKIYGNSATNSSEDAVCLVCSDLYSRSKCGEVWVMCAICKEWAHKLCTPLDEPVYVCHHCTS